MRTCPCGVNLMPLPVKLSKICRTLKASISTMSGMPDANSASRVTGLSRTSGLSVATTSSTKARTLSGWVTMRTWPASSCA